MPHDELWPEHVSPSGAESESSSVDPHHHRQAVPGAGAVGDVDVEVQAVQGSHDGVVELLDLGTLGAVVHRVEHLLERWVRFCCLQKR